VTMSHGTDQYQSTASLPLRAICFIQASCTTPSDCLLGHARRIVDVRPQKARVVDEHLTAGVT
jgi:hypothetical protein